MLRFRVETLRRARVESLIIAVGVFVALAANTWNEGRKERQMELEFLNGIAQDLEFNIEEVSFTDSRATRNKNALLRTLESVTIGATASETPEQFVVDLVFSTYLNLPRLSSITFDELQSSASMRLVREAAFKRKLAIYYRNFELLA